MKCNICTSNSERIFSKSVLGKYHVHYYQCVVCGMLQTEEPYWLNQAYSSGAISALDTGILYRNLLLRKKTKIILTKLFDDFSEFIALDYGGGEGIFVRMMRDLGFNFYRHDLYADNLYAQFFDVKDTPKGIQFNILTAFEVFEHLSEPITEIKKMLNLSQIILFSTELQPSDNSDDLEDWWYLVPETGQHVSFYSVSSLEKIANLLQLHFYTDNVRLHILSKMELKDPFKQISPSYSRPTLVQRVLKKICNKFSDPNKSETGAQNPPSLTLKDFEEVKRKFNR